MALLLELCHRTGDHARAVTEGAWTRAPDFCFWLVPLVELTGLSMGIVGFGRIGRRVAGLARAFGMRVIASSPSRRDAPDWPDFAWRSIPELFAEADVISLHCPLTADNARFVNRELLARMKPSAFLLNTARGGLIDEVALAAALASKRLAGAAVDVLSTEPPAPDNPLVGAPQLHHHSPHCLGEPVLAPRSHGRQRTERGSVFGGASDQCRDGVGRCSVVRCSFPTPPPTDNEQRTTFCCVARVRRRRYGPRSSVRPH